MPQARQPKKKEPTAVEQPILSSLLLDVNELGLLLRMLQMPWAVAQLLEPPEHKHIAANLQTKAIQAAEVFPSPNGDQPG